MTHRDNLSANGPTILHVGTIRRISMKNFSYDETHKKGEEKN